MQNPKGLRYQNLNKFQTSHRLLLTGKHLSLIFHLIVSMYTYHSFQCGTSLKNKGTPVQNSAKELMSLLCFLMPLFDSKTKSSSKRKRGYDNDSDDENDGGERMLEYFVHMEGGSGDDAQAYRKLKQLFAPFVLRRKKEDVLGQILPPKTRKVDIVPMDEATRSSYDGIISSHVKARSEKAPQMPRLRSTSSPHFERPPITPFFFATVSKLKKKRITLPAWHWTMATLGVIRAAHYNWCAMNSTSTVTTKFTVRRCT